MKRIGILNFQYSTHNFGAVLQAAALEHVCRQLGHEVKHLDFVGKARISLRRRARILFGALRSHNSPRDNPAANEQAFERFRQGFITRTRRLSTHAEFQRASRDLDVVIVGSDQVWRPAYARDALAFFLAYVPDGVHRVAYAASFGTDTWEHADNVSFTRNVGRELEKFRAVSCREASGVRICAREFGVAAAHVLDPLLLVDDSFFSRVIAESTVARGAKLIYFKLDADPGFAATLDAIAARIGYVPVDIGSRAREYREVADWLALLFYSETVVTDSFHCLCLALRFGKKVFYWPNERRGRARMDSLFETLCIEAEPTDIAAATPLLELAPRSGFCSILERERANSLKFLTDALHG